MGQTQREIGSGQPRFISPERGLMQIAQCAILNALWDLWAKCEGKPVWQLVCEMTPEQLVHCMDFRYISEVLTPEQAIVMLRELEPGKAKRIQEAKANQAVPGYDTSIGWLGFCEFLQGLADE
jgi:L-galactonate dehydratase